LMDVNAGTGSDLSAAWANALLRTKMAAIRIFISFCFYLGSAVNLLHGTG
jgi:hypothetical protein